MVVFSLAQALFGLAQLDGGAVVFFFEFGLTLVVVVEFLSHAVFQFRVAAVVLAESVLEGGDLVIGFLEFSLGVLGLGPERVDFGVFLGQNLTLVSLELVEVS